MKNNKKAVLLTKVLAILTGLSLLLSFVIPYVYLTIRPYDTQKAVQMQMWIFIVATCFGIPLIVLMILLGPKEFTQSKKYSLHINNISIFNDSLSKTLKEMKYDFRLYNMPIGKIHIYEKNNFLTNDYFVLIDVSDEYSSWESFDEFYTKLLSDILPNDRFDKNIITILCVDSLPDSINNNLTRYNFQPFHISRLFSVLDKSENVIMYPKLTDGPGILNQRQLIKYLEKTLIASNLLDK